MKMYNFNIDGLENLDKVENLEGLFNVLGKASVILLFLAVLFAIAIIFLWVFDSLGLMNLAKRKNIPNPWLAFLPVGQSYIIAKLGFENYLPTRKRNTTFVWITLGLAAATIILDKDSGELGTLAFYGTWFFESWAFYNIFKVLHPKNAIVYTVFTVLSHGLLGGLFIYLMNDEFLVNEPQEDNEENSIEIEEKENKSKTAKKNDTKSIKNSNKFCQYCGTKLNKDAKFCPECGKKQD